MGFQSLLRVGARDAQRHQSVHGRLAAAQTAAGAGGYRAATDTPFFLLCFEPLTWWRPAPAYWIWLAFNAAALVLAMALIGARRAAARSGSS